LRLLDSNRIEGIFLLAALVSTGSPTVTAGYRAAPFQGWSVIPPPDAEGSEILGRWLNPGPSTAHPAMPPITVGRHHRKWKTNTITEKKAIRYATTQPNLPHSRLDFGRHAQQAYPASRAFGPRIKTCNQVGQAE
jgi:hypothetical protein